MRASRSPSWTRTNNQWESFGPSRSSHLDVRAYRQLLDAEDKLIAERGSGFTEAERRQAVADISAAFPKGQRPHSGWDRPNRVDSLDRTVGSSGDETLGGLLEAEDARTNYAHAEGAGIDRLEAWEEDSIKLREERSAKAKLEGRKSDGSATARRADYGLDAANAWNTLASVTRAPAVREGQLTSRQRSSYARHIRDRGGVVAIANDLIAGRGSKADAEALLKPFGELDREQRSRVLAQLTVRPKYADRLWASAASTAARNPVAA